MLEIDHMLPIVNPEPYAAIQVVEDGSMLHNLTAQGWKLLQVLTESRLIEAHDQVVVSPIDQYGNIRRETVAKHHVITVTKYMLGLTIDETRDQLIEALKGAQARVHELLDAQQPLQKDIADANRTIIELRKNLENSGTELTGARRMYVDVATERNTLASDMRKIRVAIGERSMTEILS